MSGVSFLSQDKWEINWLNDYFFTIHILHFMNDSNSRNNLIGFWKFMNGYEGECVNRGKFSKPWQVTEKIIESIFVQPLQMTQTQKIITCMGSKSTNGYWVMCMIGGKFFKEWQIKILSDLIYNSYFHLTNDSNSRNNNSWGFENSQMNIRGCLWVGESFLNHAKWEIKLLGEFVFSNSHSTFNYIQNM